MDTQKNTVEVINDLIKINNDRVEGYQRAIEELNKGTQNLDMGLKDTFANMQKDSKKYIAELISVLNQVHGEPVAAGETTTSGQIYRLWMDIRSSLAGGKKTVLDLCEQGEDAALRAYNKALENPNDLVPQVLQLVRMQKERIQQSHDMIRNLRDSNRRAA